MRYHVEHFLQARLDEAEARENGKPSPDAAVLADVAVKRRIIAEAEDADHASRWSPEGDDEHGYQIVCLLASLYADHPNYQEDWRP